MRTLADSDDYGHRLISAPSGGGPKMDGEAGHSINMKRPRTSLKDIFAIPTHKKTVASMQHNSEDAGFETYSYGRPPEKTSWQPDVGTSSRNSSTPIWSKFTAPVNRSSSSAKERDDADLTNNGYPPIGTASAGPPQPDPGGPFPEAMPIDDLPEYPTRGNQQNAPTAGRFPRWKNWLEKRALERHLALGRQVARKKSWGAGVNDADAVSDEEERDDPCLSARETSSIPVRPPLHSHSFGSRFLPHLPSQPLCAVYIQVPYGTSDPARPWLPPASRTVLVVGTDRGLFAFERTPSMNSTSKSATESSGAASTERSDWNEDIRCRQIWTGLGVYQLAILQPCTDAESNSPGAGLPFLGTRSSDTSSSRTGVMLGLCSPIAGRTSRSSRLSRLSSHPGVIYETQPSQTSSSASVGSCGQASNHGHANAQSFEQGFSATHFGIGAGTFTDKLSPTDGSGTVKMWNLEAVHRVVAYVLNDPHARPLDLSVLSNRQPAKSTGFLPGSQLSGKIRSAWASLSEPRISQRQRMPSRRAESDSYGFVHPYDPRGSAASGPSSLPSPADFSPEEEAEPELRGGHEGNSNSPDERDQALRLAQASVSITSPPTSGRPSSHRRTTSAYSVASASTSVFSETEDSDSDGRKGKEPAAERTNGCLFFAVHQALTGQKGAGTWYLALASAKGVLLFEASPPRKQSSMGRSWSFLKEFYTPMPPKSMAFVSAASAVSPTQCDESQSKHSPMVHTGSVAKLSLEDHERPRSFWSEFSEKPALTGSSYRKSHQRSQSNVLLSSQPGKASNGASWGGADLCLLVSFGKRAVTIRLSDSRVHEINIPLDKGKEAAADMAIWQSAPGRFDSHRPHWQHRHSSSDYAAAFERQSVMKSQLKPSQVWVGLDIIETNVEIGCLIPSFAGTDGQGSNSQTEFQSAWFAPRSHPASTCQGPIDARCRATTNHFGHESDDDDDDDDEWAEYDKAGNPGLALPRFSPVQLRDRGAHPFLQRGRGTASGCDNTAGIDLAPQETVEQLDAALPDVRCLAFSFDLKASVALVTRGQVTRVFPHPLPQDLASASPLSSLRWSAVPHAVTAWSRVLGLERAMTSGPVPTSHLTAQRKESHHQRPPLTHMWPSRSMRPLQAQAGTLSTAKLQISLTVLAFTPYKIEMQRVTFGLDNVALPKEFAPNIELELRSSTKPTRNSPTATQKLHQLPVLDPSLRSSLASGYHKDAIDLEYPSGFLLPSPQVGGHIPRTVISITPSHKENKNLNEMTSDASSSCLVAPEDTSPWEAGGDGGAWIFTHRGGDDWRVSFVGAEV